MKLTMHILEDALKEYKISTLITKGSRSFDGVRLGKPSEKTSHAFLYKKGANIICFFENDTIIVYNNTIENVSNSINDYIDVCNSLQNKLNEIVYKNGSLQDIVDLAEEVFKNPIFIIDELNLVKAISSHKPGTVNEEWDYILEHNSMPFDRVSAIKRNENLKKTSYKNIKDLKPFFFNPPGMYHRGINYRIPDNINKRFLGTFIIIENETPITVGMLHLSELITDTVNEWFNLNQNTHQMQTPSKFFLDILEGKIKTPTEDELKKVLTGTNSNNFVLVVSESETDKSLQHIIPFTESNIEDCQCFEYNDEIIIFCPIRDNFDNIKNLLHTIALSNNIRFGISYVFHNLNALQNSYKQALIALERNNNTISVLDSKSSMEYIGKEMKRSLDSIDICHPALQTLELYDKKHGTEYYKTLYIFLKKERSLIETSRELSIHRNSLIYRVEKIKILIGDILDDFEIREYIMFSFRITNQK